MHRIAVISGDGVGEEIVPEGIRVVDAAAQRFGFRIEWQTFPWGCEYRESHGAMMPPDGLDVLRDFEAISFGAVGVSLELRIMFHSGDC